MSEDKNLYLTFTTNIKFVGDSAHQIKEVISLLTGFGKTEEEALAYLVLSGAKREIEKLGHIAAFIDQKKEQ